MRPLIDQQAACVPLRPTLTWRHKAPTGVPARTPVRVGGREPRPPVRPNAQTAAPGSPGPRCPMADASASANCSASTAMWLSGALPVFF